MEKQNCKVKRQFIVDYGEAMKPIYNSVGADAYSIIMTVEEWEKTKKIRFLGSFHIDDTFHEYGYMLIHFFKNDNFGNSEIQRDRAYKILLNEICS